ncbi:hypothetical protein [Streptomyces sp. AC154]|uniref:hypothetical protein n=1 Tax=Streptomyces sp. AC154 TaxID=3143184 RepID=UPI003F8061A9
MARRGKLLHVRVSLTACQQAGLLAPGLGRALEAEVGDHVTVDPGRAAEANIPGGCPMTEPRPTPEDLLVVYLGEPVPDSLVERLEQHGGKQVPAHNPYWDTWGVTVQDPDGYLLVLSTRNWSNS